MTSTLDLARQEVENARQALEVAKARLREAEKKSLSRRCPFKPGAWVPLDARHVLFVHQVTRTERFQEKEKGAWFMHGLVCLIEGGQANPAFDQWGMTREEELTEQAWLELPASVRQQTLAGMQAESAANQAAGLEKPALHLDAELRAHLRNLPEAVLAGARGYTLRTHIEEEREDWENLIEQGVVMRHADDEGSEDYLCVTAGPRMPDALALVEGAF